MRLEDLFMTMLAHAPVFLMSIVGALVMLFKINVIGKPAILAAVGFLLISSAEGFFCVTQLMAFKPNMSSTALTVMKIASVGANLQQAAGLALLLKAVALGRVELDAKKS